MPAYKSQNGTWYIKYNNKTKRGFSTKKEAEKYEAQIKLGTLNNYNNITFEQIALDYLNYKKNIVQYGTYDKYRKTYNEVIKKNFNTEMKVCNIKKMHCRMFRDEISKKEYSTKHKNFIITVFKSIFKHGTVYFDIRENPSASIERFKSTYDDMLKMKEKELNIWTTEEFNKFIAEIDKEVYKVFFIVLYYSGMRLGEALALKWKDFEDNKLDIYKSITFKTNKGTYEEKEPKNANSIRKIDIGSNIASIIEEYHLHEMKIPGYKDTWYMFGRKKPLSTSNINRIRDDACNSANVKRIRIHDLRHSHASYLISKGVNIVAVSRRLGHSDINMTLKTYTHLFQDKEKEIIDILDNSSQNLLTPYQ